MNKGNPFAGADCGAMELPRENKVITVTLEIPYGVEFIVGCSMAYDGGPDLMDTVLLKQLTSNEGEE